MKPVKQAYIDTMHLLGSAPAIAQGPLQAAADPYGWPRWFASLFAIYDTDRMIALDCPWWNVAATRRMEQFLDGRPNARVFEYGAGASSVWLARRAGEVITVEHDGAWHSRFSRQLAHFPNVRLLHRALEGNGEDYVGAIDEAGGSFDLVVIDGRVRARCLEVALSRLGEGGLILFDDSGRGRYREAIETCGLREDHFFGRSYCVPYPDHTSVLRRDDR